ncbi:MAG TPA: GEVED domain-containing protein, partial [bacterium]|nr:GEVED domain-containing protein [bacterium]
MSSPLGAAGAGLYNADVNANTGWQHSVAVTQSLAELNAGLPVLGRPTVTWTGGALSGPVTQNPLRTPPHPTPGTYTYTATLTENGCTVSDSVVVTVVAPIPPVADFTASVTSPLVGDVVFLYDQSTNQPSAWQWTISPGTGFTVVNSQHGLTSPNPRVIFTVGGCYTITLTVTNPAGTSTLTKASYVCARPAYCAGVQTAPCDTAGAYIDAVRILGTTLSNRGTGCPAGPVAYSAFPAADSTTATLQAGQQYSLRVTSSSIGSVAAWLDLNANGTFEASEYLSLTQAGTPPLPITSTVQFTVPANAPGSPIGLRVRHSPQTTSLAAGDACAPHATGETEDYELTIRPACTLATPTVSTNSPVCVGSPVTLSAPNAPAGATYAWTGPNSFASTAAAPTIPNATAAAAGTYSLVITLNGCSAPAATATVAVNPIPAAPGPLSGSRCGPGTITLQYTGVPTGTSFRWYTTASGGSPIPNAGSRFVTPALAATTTYYVSAVVAGCESPRTAVTATINPEPTVSLTAGGPVTFCQGGSVTLSAAASGAGPSYTYAWRRGTSPVAGATGPTYVATQAGSYTVIVTSSMGCAITSSPVTVTVNPTPSAAFTYSSGTFCRAGTANPTPTIQGMQGGFFRAAPAGLVLNATTGQITLASSNPGTYTVTYSFSGGTCPVSQTQTVTITTAPAAGFSYAAAPACAGSAASITPTFSAGASAGRFTATPAGLTLATTSGAINLATSAPGTYTITNTIPPGGSCPSATATATLTVVASPAPTVSASGPLTFCAGDSVRLTATGGTSYLWSNGATTQRITVTQSGTYSVTATNA